MDSSECSAQEGKALETLRTFLSRRGLATETERITTDQIDRVELYTIGKILVIFSRKEKILSPDVNNYAKFAAESGYTYGVIVVTCSKPSENVLIAMKARAKDPMHFFHIRELQYDITLHRMSMPHKILKPDEITAMMKANKVNSLDAQLPWIDSQDIQARILGAVPGDVIEITRHSDTAGVSKYYRYCVADVNVG